MQYDKKLIHTVFAAQAKRTPDAVAIEVGETKVSFSTLEKTASRVGAAFSGYLREPEEVVALFLPSGIPLVAGIIGALKAGGIFMPIDPLFPQSRIGAMLRQGAPVALMTTADLRDAAQAALTSVGSTAPVIVVDESGRPITNDTGKLPDTFDGDSGCYLLFTSGSTGQPKGILGQNKGLSHFVHWEINEFDLGADERIPLLAPPTFDVSLRDIFVPLIAGGALVIPPNDIRANMERMVRWLGEKAITTMHIVPSLFRLMMRAIEEDKEMAPKALRRILLAGETLYGADVALWRKLGGTDRAELVNLYGPSETTLAKLYHRIGEADLFKPKEIVPLGLPISNTAVLILRNGRLCDIGQMGEIYIKTPFRSKGYFDDPEKTAALFVQNPLNDKPDILYKTGDMGLYRPDRSVAFIGRADRQVKVNGVRIEPGEIEQAARDLSGVREVAVTPHTDDQREVRLALYYTAENTIGETTLREHLTQLLPATMLPAWLVRLDAMPLNLHGKVDRAALPAPEELLYANRQVVEPRNDIEARLAAIWKETLGLDRISVLSPFVDLGGDSLKAIRVVSRISREFGVETPLRALFDHPTVAALAEVVDHMAASTTLQIEPTPDAESYPLSAGQMRLFTLDQVDRGASAYNMVDAFEIRGSFVPSLFGVALNRAVSRHESLRTTFHQIDGTPRQVVHPTASVSIVVDDHNGDTAWREITARIVAEEATTPFPLDQLPLLRARVLRFAHDHHAIVVTFHHIAVDGWSFGVVAKEVMADYDTLLEGKTPTTTPLLLQYRDYAVWQNQWLESDAADRERMYWHEQFVDAPPPIELPTDFARPALQTFNGATLASRSFSSATRHGIKRFGAERDASLFVTLIALVTSLLHRYTSQEDMVIGSPVAGRVAPELEDQVGMYINMLPIRTRLTNGASFSEVFASAHDAVAGALGHQNYPFDRLIDELGFHRDISRSPLFDVMVALQSMEITPFALSGAAVTPYPAETVISRNDLTFIFIEEGDDLRLELNFNTDLFRPARIEKMLDHFMRLADSLLTNPHAPVASVAMLAEPELRRVLDGINPTERTHGPHRSVVTLFDERAATDPDRIAIIDGARSVTYGECKEAADTLAMRIASFVERDQPVAVLLDRSWRWVVSILAVMKAGGVYLPLTPDLPEERLRLILETSGATVAVGDTATMPTLRAMDGIVTLIDVASNETGKSAPLLSPTKEQGAYMIFTSGSTGRPKGVTLSHGGLLNMALAQIAHFGVSPTDRVLQFATATFDASLSELFMALLSGGGLVIADRSTIEYPPSLLELMARAEVTVATFPPPYLRALDHHPLPTLRVIISAGEAAVADDLRHYASRGKRVFNAYGPTEFSVCATIHPVDPTASYDTPLPIGRPIDNTEVYILNDQMSPQPIGVAGEICLAGAGLAIGYRADDGPSPFVTHPFKEGERLYRTGDRGLLNDDGELIFLGRVDDQIKLRGYRIELDEIRHALESHPGVGQAIVSVVASDDQTLVAHYTEKQKIELWPSVAEFFVYDDLLYKAMYDDRKRNDRYRAAFKKALPGKSVLEIGPGPELVLSRMALDAGARHVYAIEILEETYRSARARIDQLGLGDRITLIHGDARKVNLPEMVDYCISEIVGGIGGSEGAAAIINDARRFLKDPSAMLPQQTLTRIAACSLTENDFEYGFTTVAGRYVEKIFDQIGRPFDLRLCLKNVDESNLISTSDYLEKLDHTQPTPLEEDRDIRLTITEDAPLTGLLVWLRLLIDKEEFVDVLTDQASWLPVYFPLFKEGVDVGKGDVIDLTIRRRLCENGLNPDYLLEGAVTRSDGRRIPVTYSANHMSADFRKDPFYQRLFDEQGRTPLVTSIDADTLRDHLAKKLPSYMIPTHFVRVESFSLTRNGKIDRNALPSPIRSTHEQASPTTPIERLLAELWRHALGGTDVGVTDDFFSLGGDSIKAIRIVSRLRAKGYALKVRDIFATPTIRALAPTVAPIKNVAEQGPVTGVVPFAPIQKWFFHQFENHLAHFNQAVTLHFHDPMDTAALTIALQTLVNHHDMLRAVYRTGPAGVEQTILPPEKVTASLIEIEDGMIDAAIQAVNGPFDLESAPLLRAAYVRRGAGHSVIVAIHHLVVDTFSWGTLLEDLATAYEQALTGAPPSLPVKSDQYRTYVERLLGALEKRHLREADFWRRTVTAPPAAIPVDNDADRLTAGMAREVTESLAADETTTLLTGVDHAYHTKIDDLLLTALARTIRAFTGESESLVMMEGHGRESDDAELDLGRTVGWFTAAYPIRFHLEGEDIGAHLVGVKESVRGVPDHGVGYHTLAYLREKGSIPRVATQIGFNYLGEIVGPKADGPFTIDVNDTGKNTAPDAPRPHPLDMQAMIFDGKLMVTLTYCGERYRRETADRFIKTYLRQLRELVSHCAGKTDGEKTASDFTWSELTVDELDDIFSA